MKLKVLLTLILLFISSLVLAENSALVIVDMQSSFFEDHYETHPYEQTHIVQRLKSSILNLIKLARNSDTSIILVEYEGYGPTEPDILLALEDYEKLVIIKKHTDGVFDEHTQSRQKLDKLLEDQNISHLVFSGINGSACVCDSVNGALELGYDVTSYAPSVASFEHGYVLYPYWSPPILIEFDSGYYETNKPNEIKNLFDKNNTVSKQICNSYLDKY